ncbi:hypothetical protein RclHR1_03980011 [Rhizophagus clarus]|nr:hypothetical protein RclHR1_03980011 [Rhizophagus clarus]
MPLESRNKHNKIRKSSSLAIREKKDLIQSQQSIEPIKKITTTMLRKVFRTNCLIKIWDTYKSLVKDGNLKFLETHRINQLMRLIKELDKDPVSRLEKFQTIHKDLENVGTKKTQEIQNFLIEAYIDNNMIDKAREVFNKINEQKYIGKSPLKRLIYCNAFNIMIAAYGMQGKNLEEVTKLFALMHEKELTPNGTTKTILKNIFRYHLNNDAISWIRELRKKKLTDVGLEKEILLILLKSNNLKEAVRTFEDMKARDLKPDIYSYVPLIHQLAQHERVDEALELIEEIREQEAHPNVVAYNVFAKVYNMASKYEQTNQIIENMLKQNIQPNTLTFNQLINACSKVGNIDLALRIIKKMSDLNIQPNEYIYSSMIEMFSNLSDINKAFQTCQLMIKSGIEPNVRIYNALISLFAEKRDTNGAYLLFHEMRRFGLSPDSYTYTSLINAYVKASDINTAEKIFSEMEKARIEPSTTTYNVFMSYYVKKKNIKQLRHLFNEIIRRNIQPDNFTYCCLIDGFCSKNDLESAIILLNNMQNRNLKPDAHIYTVLINAYIKNGNFSKAKSLYEAMIKEKINPTFVTYAVLIDGHARIGELDFSRKLLSELISQSIDGTMNQMAYKNKVLNPDIFTPLMDAYAKQGQTEPAWAIFKEMATLGVKHNLYVYTILMDAYYRGHNYEAVWQMWKVMKKNLTTTLSKSKMYKQLLDSQQKERKENSFSTMTLAESKWSSSLLISFSLLYSSRSIKQSPPNQAVSIMINALTAAKEFKLIELEWNKLNNEEFEFDCLNYNNYIQSLIISEKIKLACKLLNEHLIKGWEKGLALSNIYKEKYSIESVKYRQELLKHSSEFYPHKKTLILLANYLEKTNFEINQGKGNKKIAQYLKELKDEFPEVFNIAQELFESWKLNKSG